MDLKNEKNKGLLALGLYIILFSLGVVVVSLLVEVLLMLLGADLTHPKVYNISAALINLLSYVVLSGVLIFLYRKEIVTDFKLLKSYRLKGVIIKVLAGFGIFYAISLLGNYLISNVDYYGNLIYKIFKLGEFNTTSDNQASIEAMLEGPSFWMMFLAAGFLGPLCEELVFRKAMFSICKTKEMGILVSSLLFGFIHITSSLLLYDGVTVFLMVFPYIVSGVALAIVYLKGDRNIMIPTIAHMLSNILSMIMIVIGL